MDFKICNTCGKEFKPYSCQSKGLFCGYKCYHVSLKNKPSNRAGKKGTTAWNKGIKLPNQSKEKHPNWKGGLSKEVRDGYNRVDYNTWRISVFKRDDFTCQECFKKGVFLNAHHIKSYAKFPLLRYDINNGQTLCVECHKRTPNYAGKNKKYVEKC